MADWSQLPPELILLISKRLEARFDVIRFRSVCCTWRSSVPPKVCTFPSYLPPVKMFQHAQLRFARNTFYLLRLFRGNQSLAPACWLVKTRDGTEGFKIRLFNPLTDSELPPLPENFPKVLDLTNYQVLELGHEYFGEYFSYHPLFEVEPRYLDCRMRLVLLRESADSDDLIMVASCARTPRFLRPGENEWIVLENLKGIEDIVSFNGKFYAIDEEGTIIVIDQSLNVSFLGRISFGLCYLPRRRRARKFLVKFVDKLLAIEKIWNPYAETPLICCSSISFRVFRINEEEQKWDKMRSLGDRILFLSIHQAILAPSWSRGNLIFFSERLCNCDYTFVFDLEDGAASLLEDWSVYCNLFWPPPPLDISSTENLPKRVTSAGKEVGTPSSKCTSKLCCF